MKKLVRNKKSLMAAAILLTLVMVAAGFWQYTSTPRVLAQGVVSINVGQGQSHVDQLAKTPVDLQPKDPYTRQLLQQQGIDPEYTELVQDYGKALTASERAAKQARGDKSPDPSPYGRTYRDSKTGKYILETQGLPMVDADGNSLIPRWEQTGQNYQAKNNLFNLQVDADGRTELIAKNDQPDGRRANDAITFKPELYVGTIQQIVGSPTLLAVDPINPNYTENVLEWDYGVIKRWVRLIESRYLGYWLRPVDLNQDIRIIYNQTGNFKLKLGRFGVGEDEEFVPALIMEALIPQVSYEGRSYYLISDSATFYPDANPETSSVDGWAGVDDSWTWSTIRTEAGQTGGDTDTEEWPVMYWSSSTSPNWRNIRRMITLFDTSILGSSANISAATLSLRSNGKDNTFTGSSPSINCYASNPASNTGVTAADYDYNDFGTTAFCDTSIAYSAWGTAGYNDFALNSSGIAAINKTGVSKFGFRTTADAANSEPAWESSKWGYFSIYFAEQGTGYQPKLVIIYTTSSLSNNPSSVNMGAVGPSSITSTGLYFTVTNNSGSAVNITISGTDITGGTTWTLSDTATPGPTTAGLKASLDGVNYNIIIRKTAPFNTLVSNLANSASQNWGLQLLAPTTYTDSTQKTGTVTLTATTN
jgi:hypothetical protein